MSNSLIEFLDACEAQGVRLICWKGYHKIALALAGKADLDLYVEPSGRANFERVARKAGLIELVAPVNFKDISHWYLPETSSHRWLHLHVYYQARTGASYAKGYIIDSERWMEVRVRSTDGIYILPNELACDIHLTRLKLRRTGLLSELFYRREQAKHDKEMAFLRLEAGSENRPVLRYERESEASTLRSVHNICVRLNAKIRGRRKRLEQGVIISIIGTDGSGKSTLTEALGDFFSQEMELVRMSFGRPKFTFTTSLFWLVCNLAQRANRNTTTARPLKHKGKQRATSLSVSFYHLILGLERFFVIRRARRLASSGRLILMDRAPTQTVGQMDGPKILAKGGLVGCLATAERILYKAMGPVDLVLRLSLSSDVAVLRNHARNKLGKETDEEILARYELFTSYVPDAQAVTVIDASGSQCDVMKLSVKAILDNLNADMCCNSDD